MDLKSGYPYRAVKNGLMYAFPQLNADLSCDVVVGAGITGALISDELANHGHDVIVLDQRDVGWGSTSASTGAYSGVQVLVDLLPKSIIPPAATTAAAPRITNQMVESVNRPVKASDT